MNRLKTSSVKSFREQELVRQGGNCKLCGLPITGDAVLDHDHKTGDVRGVLHRGCNALLGKLENNYRRMGVPNLAVFLQGAVNYIQLPALDIKHPSFKTEDEKRIARNKKARRRRKSLQV